MGRERKMHKADADRVLGAKIPMLGSHRLGPPWRLRIRRHFYRVMSVVMTWANTKVPLVRGHVKRWRAVTPEEAEAKLRDMAYSRLEKTWLGPPHGWAGGQVPWHLDLIRNDHFHVALYDFLAYPTGVEFSMHLRSRRQGEGHPAFILGGSHGPVLELRYSDERKTIAATPPTTNYDDEPSEPVLRITYGGGSPGDTRYRWWLWPLPPPGPLSISLTWPSEDIDNAFTVDANELVRASEQAEQLWEYDPEEWLQDL